jgi:hypothetical protein
MCLQAVFSLAGYCSIIGGVVFLVNLVASIPLIALSFMHHRQQCSVRSRKGKLLSLKSCEMKVFEGGGGMRLQFDSVYSQESVSI